MPGPRSHLWVYAQSLHCSCFLFLGTTEMINSLADREKQMPLLHFPVQVENNTELQEKQNHAAWIQRRGYIIRQMNTLMGPLTFLELSPCTVLTASRVLFHPVLRTVTPKPLSLIQFSGGKKEGKLKFSEVACPHSHREEVTRHI